MRKPKQKDNPPSPVIDNGPITANNYADRELAYSRARSGEWFMIRNRTPKLLGPPTPAEWHAWEIYLSLLGLTKQVAWMNYFGAYQAPARWPDEFDPAAEISDRFWEFPSRAAINAEMRAGVNFGRLAGAVTLKPDQFSRHRVQTPGEAESTISAGFPHLQGPLAVSDDLRRSLGTFDDLSPGEFHGEF